MTLSIDSAILLAILAAACRSIWLVSAIKTTLAFVVQRVENHEARISSLEQR